MMARNVSATALGQRSFRIAVLCAGLLAAASTAAVVLTLQHAAYARQAAGAPAIEASNHANQAANPAGQSIPVPDLTGMTQQDAVQAIRNAHLALGTVAALPYPSGPAGTVVAQDPVPGAQDVDHPRVALLLASGTSLANPPASTGAVVPQLVGMSLHQAAQALMAAGFKLGNTVDVSSPGTSSTANANPGVVIVQVPRAATRLPHGAKIDLTIQR